MLSHHHPHYLCECRKTSLVRGKAYCDGGSGANSAFLCWGKVAAAAAVLVYAVAVLVMVMVVVVGFVVLVVVVVVVIVTVMAVAVKR